MKQEVIDMVEGLMKEGKLNYTSFHLENIESGSIHNFGACVFTVKYNGEVTHRGRICHGGLSLVIAARENIAAIVTRPLPYSKYYEDEFLRAYYHWLVVESPVANVFVTKDVDKGIADGFILDPEAPIGEFLHACILSRVPTEVYAGGTIRRDLWVDMVKAGVCWPLSVAYSYLAPEGYYVLTRGGESVLAIRPKINYYGAHSPYNVLYMHLEDFYNLLSGKVNKTPSNSKPYNSTDDWGGCFSLFNTANCEYTEEKVLSGFWEEMDKTYGLTRKTNNWGSYNEFWKKLPTKSAVTEMYIKHVLAFQEELYAALASKEVKVA